MGSIIRWIVVVCLVLGMGWTLNSCAPKPTEQAPAEEAATVGEEEAAPAEEAAEAEEEAAPAEEAAEEGGEEAHGH